MFLNCAGTLEEVAPPVVTEEGEEGGAPAAPAAPKAPPTRPRPAWHGTVPSGFVEEEVEGFIITSLARAPGGFISGGSDGKKQITLPFFSATLESIEHCHLLIRPFH